MFCKIVFRSKAMNRVLKPAKGLTAFSPMIYWRTARFGILEDKLKEIKKEAFSRIKIAKGRPEQVEEENKFVVDRLKLFGDSSSKMHEFSISGMTLDEVVTRLKTALEAKEKSYDLYYNIIDRINQVVIDEPEKTGKDEVLKILRVLCYYRPKDEEKFIREAKYKGYVSKDQDFLSQKHLEKIKNNLDQFATPVGHAINYIEKGLKRNYLRDILIDYTESMDKTMSKSIYDIIERYRILFINLELFVQEHLNRKNIDHREAIDVLVSFSIAGEGSNLLYERIAEQIEPALKESKYTLHDIELIVNYNIFIL